jgi:hypothetical protein
MITGSIEVFGVSFVPVWDLHVPLTECCGSEMRERHMGISAVATPHTSVTENTDLILRDRSSSYVVLKDGLPTYY